MGNAYDLGDAVAAIGQLIGLLTGTDNDLNVNPDWFSDPVTELGQAATRLNNLVTLISSILGPGIATPPDVFPDAQWYTIPDPTLGTGTVFHLVTSNAADTSGQLGLGVLDQIQLGSLTIQAYLYMPFYSYSQGESPQFITANPANPSQIGLYISTSDSFNVNGVSFTAMNIEAEIYLADQAPGFKLEFVNLKGAGNAPDTYNSLQNLLDPTVESWIGEVVVQNSAWLNMFVGYGKVTSGEVYDNQNATNTAGDLLTAANFLTKDNQGTFHLSLQNLQGQTASEIALNFVFAILDALATQDFPIISLPGGGIYIACDTDAANGSSKYGIRFVINLPLTSGQSTDTGGAPTPAVNLCMGSWLTGESDTGNWMTRITKSTLQKAGVSILVLNRDSNKNLSFAPSFELSSIGLNIQGGSNTPLFNVSGYTLNGAELRAYLNSTDWTFGVAVRLDNIAFPLGPSFDQAQQSSASTNPVGNSLLASSNSQPNGAIPTSTVNPGFSAEAAYVLNHAPLLEIFDQQGSQTDLIWFPIQRRFGPLNCQKIGLKVDVSGSQASDPVLGIVFDGDVLLGALEIDVDQLSLNVHLKEIADVSGYDVDLQGLDVTFNGGGVDISGGLLKTTDAQGWISYDGEALIKIEDLTIRALGSFGSLPGGGGTSLFIFAMLNYPLGGPSFFFVTGLAAGFGYNRSLKIPGQNDVQNFPLVAGLANTSLLGGDTPNPQQALAALEQWVPPERGEYWLAAGLQFTTFEIINTNALLIVEFGREFVIALLGLSTLKQPLVGDTYVYAELGIEVVLLPEAGEFKASAVLAANSYVLTPQAHLTGGFAFYAWFGDNEHSGDFAFTIGGYHPAFNVPDHYPQEPRVGINWRYSDKLLLNGEAYFAITPTAMMAGAGLQLTFTDGPLNAWLKAQVDIILYWKPFYLLADASISVGVSYRVDALFVHKTFSVELSAEFHLWGPPIGGTAHINWYIISFTVSFGPSPNPPTKLDWADFKGMLPSKTQQQSSGEALHTISSANAVAPATSGTATTTPAYLYINVNDGLKSTQTQEGLTLWLVRAGQFRFTIGSAIPATKVLVGDPGSGNQVSLPGQPVGLRHVNGGITPANYQSAQTVTILQLSADDLSSIRKCLATASPCTTMPSGCGGKPMAVTRWQINAVTQNLPQAMWGAPVPEGQNPDINASTPTATGTIGVTMCPNTAPMTNCTPEMVIDEIFSDRTVNPNDEYRLPLAQALSPAANTPQPADSFADIAGINAPAIVAKRAAVFNALQNLGVNVGTNEPLPLMAANPGQDFADEPLEGSTAPNLT